MAKNKTMGSQPDPAEETLRRLDGTVATLCLRHSGCVTSDVREDCYLEALLMLWRIRDKLASLPHAEREPYGRVCVRNAVARVLQREHETKAREVSLEELADAGGLISSLHPVYLETENAIAQELLDTVSSPALATALCSLPPREYEVLDLVYGQGLNDSEAATRLNTSPEALRKRRERTLAKIRRRLVEAS